MCAHAISFWQDKKIFGAFGPLAPGKKTVADPIRASPDRKPLFSTIPEDDATSISLGSKDVRSLPGRGPQQAF